MLLIHSTFRKQHRGIRINQRQILVSYRLASVHENDGIYME